MKAMRSSHFNDIDRIQVLALSNAKMIKSGAKEYVEFISLMKNMSLVSEDTYTSIPEIYETINVSPFITLSKRNLYSNYNNGVIVGAGSGEDCNELIENSEWKLFDLTDSRMTKAAVGYCVSTGSFSIVSTKQGDTVAPVKEKYKQREEKIDVLSIDSLDLTSCSIISVDAEGLGVDVLSGALETINKFKPDLLLSIYHNWIEYLLTIPLIYDLGYEIIVVKTSNFDPHQPHLELTLLCKWKNK